MLLWHGSRLTNWVGILSQGLRIAPPEAPVTGYMVRTVKLTDHKQMRDRQHRTDRTETENLKPFYAFIVFVPDKATTPLRSNK